MNDKIFIEKTFNSLEEVKEFIKSIPAEEVRKRILLWNSGENKNIIVGARLKTVQRFWKNFGIELPEVQGVDLSRVGNIWKSLPSEKG